MAQRRLLLMQAIDCQPFFSDILIKNHNLNWSIEKIKEFAA
jgi:hypothetical protein